MTVYVVVESKTRAFRGAFGTIVAALKYIAAHLDEDYTIVPTAIIR